MDIGVADESLNGIPYEESSESEEEEETEEAEGESRKTLPLFIFRAFPLPFNLQSPVEIEEENTKCP